METIGLDTLSPTKGDHQLQFRDEDGEYQHDAISSLRNDSNVPLHHRKYVRYGVMIGLLVVVIVAIAVPVSNSSKQASTSSAALTAPLEPVVVEPQVSSQELESNKDQLSEALLTYYDTYGLDWAVAMDDQSPQALAMEWVAGQSQYATLDRSRNVQRYVLATLYYSTYNKQHQYWNEALGHVPTGWTSAMNWITDEDECDWEGITCEGEAVVGILLREHRLSGTLPLELAFLSTSLNAIDLTTNFVYVDGDAPITPLSHLARVESLLLEDNYVVATRGLPRGMSVMTDLTKVSLSYNLLQGHLDGTVFTDLSKLTHLEIESNFLAGALPKELLHLPDLVYLYIRSNLLDLHLPTVLGNGTLPSLFAVWMDANNVTGPIPSTVADKVSLASFSITNTSLGSSIPAAMGNLTDMRRLWLYDNDLTGDVPTELANMLQLEVFEVHGNKELRGEMPEGVCTVIQNATYEFKSLTATCDSVSCDCCTECY